MTNLSRLTKTQRALNLFKTFFVSMDFFLKKEVIGVHRLFLFVFLQPKFSMKTLDVTTVHD